MKLNASIPYSWLQWSLSLKSQCHSSGCAIGDERHLPDLSLHFSRNYRATLQPFLTSFLKPAPFPSGPPTMQRVSLNMQGKQRGLECPELALASCLPSVVNDQQQVEPANGESNKPPESCPPSCAQFVLLLGLWRTRGEASAAISLWPWLLESSA